jgi:hypothetical protein
VCSPSCQPRWDSYRLESAATAGVIEDEAVQVQDEGDRQRLVGVQAHECIDRVAVAGELPLIAVAKAPRALRYALRALAVEHDALDRVRRGDRGDARMLEELPQQLRQLVREQPLATPARVDPGEDGAEPARLASEGPVYVNEAKQRANHAIVELKRWPISSIIVRLARFLARFARWEGPPRVADGGGPQGFQHRSKAREASGPCVQPRLQGFSGEPEESIPRLTIASAEVPRQRPSRVY